ncbi:MAG: phosphoenolpyruvate-utilizing N-terminal domain-containing protein, partial [Candidatus Sumerlaeia bacterium]
MTTKTTHQKLAGFSISPGLGIGNAYLYSDGSHRFQVVYKIGPGEVAAEARRVKKAFRQVLQDLEHSKSEVKRNLDEDFARIFHMHQEMLKDPSLYDEIREMIEQTRLNAEFVVTAIFQRQEERLLKAGNGGMAHGAGDISDLSKRVLCVLTGEDANQLANLPQGTVVVAKQLLPSDTVHFSRRSISGVVIEYGGSTSHAAILTRELGIPAVSGIEDVVQKISNGQILLVDGEDGTVTVEPNKAEKETVRRRLKEISSQRARVKELANKPATTRDGVTVKVMANISCREDAA